MSKSTFIMFIAYVFSFHSSLGNVQGDKPLTIDKLTITEKGLKVIIRNISNKPIVILTSYKNIKTDSAIFWAIFYKNKNIRSAPDITIPQTAFPINLYNYKYLFPNGTCSISINIDDFNSALIERVSLVVKSFDPQVKLNPLRLDKFLNSTEFNRSMKAKKSKRSRTQLDRQYLHKQGVINKPDSTRVKAINR